MEGESMELSKHIAAVDLSSSRSKEAVVAELVDMAKTYGYLVVDQNLDKPWGAYIRFDSESADGFISQFFEGLDAVEARLGIKDMELSPKFLLVIPEARLSWQRHQRRAERWAYLTRGGYYKSMLPGEPGELQDAQPGDVVQFKKGECHRLVGTNRDAYTLVAEIWQHTDPENPSDESDIERIADDYQR